MASRRKSANILTALNIAVCILAVGCDPVNQVVTRNVTNIPIVLYYDENGPPSEGLSLRAGQVDSTAGMIGSMGKKIKAYDPNGLLIFCRIYTNRDLDGGVLRIDIQSGLLSC
jgi:hypothetical protein